MEVCPLPFWRAVILTIAQSILDFSREFDVSVMDNVVIAFYSGVGQEVRMRIDTRNMRIPDLVCGACSNKWPNKS